MGWKTCDKCASAKLFAMPPNFLATNEHRFRLHGIHLYFMPRITGIELVGTKFGRLTVTDFDSFTPRHGPKMKCTCDCGVPYVAMLCSLKAGDTKSCGCLLRETLALPTALRGKTTRSRPPMDYASKRASQERWKSKNKAKVAATSKRFRERHKEEVRTLKALYYQRAKPRILAKLKLRFATDPCFRLECIVRARIRKALRSQQVIKSKRMLQILGCSLQEFRAHLEQQFTVGMSWEKVFSGDIHVDHLTPLRAFDMRDPEQLAQAFHYTNHGPKWWYDNLKKSDTLPNGKSARTIKRY